MIDYPIENSEKTYKSIAFQLKAENRCFIAWTDGHGSQYDILFVRNPGGHGPIQGGIRFAGLLVAIMRVGAFGFDITADADTYASYYKEKFGYDFGPAAEPLADLINGVRRKLT